MRVEIKARMYVGLHLMCCLFLSYCSINYDFVGNVNRAPGNGFP
jgi:hypothetical protein